MFGALAIVILAAGRCSAADSPLTKLAAAKFPNLTRAERAMLEFADKGNINRGEFAIAGSRSASLDPSNDPAHASEWSHDRDIRAGLIRWLAVDNSASVLVDPKGVRVLGARIVGKIDLAHVRVPFAIVLARSSIPDRMNLESVEVPYIDLGGSHTGPVHAPNLTVHGDLIFGNPVWGQDRGGFDASGLVNLVGARIEGVADFAGGHFHYSEEPSQPWTKPERLALLISDAEIGGDVTLDGGFESRGCAFLAENKIGGDLNCFGGRFINPGNAALEAGGNEIKGVVFLGPNPGFAPNLGFESDGLVMFENTHVAAFFLVERAKFGGKTPEPHGFFATGLSVQGGLIWHDVKLDNRAIVDLSGASVGYLFDQESSWPSPGKLLVDGFTYSGLAARSSYFADWTSPADAGSRLRWLALQPGFHPQPYRQLAKVLADSGDDTGALQVRIAAEDLRYAQFGVWGRIWGAFLKYTIGYGRRPLLTVLWALVVITLGWSVIRFAMRKNLMRPTYPENTPNGADRSYEPLHPLLYSIDLFFPFVNLHQEHYWWPNSEAAGGWRLFGHSVRFSSLIRYYLWFQIGAGWLLSAIFVAGVTGLIRGD